MRKENEEEKQVNIKDNTVQVGLGIIAYILKEKQEKVLLTVQPSAFRIKGHQSLFKYILQVYKINNGELPTIDYLEEKIVEVQKGRKKIAEVKALFDKIREYDVANYTEDLVQKSIHKSKIVGALFSLLEKATIAMEEQEYANASLVFAELAELSVKADTGSVKLNSEKGKINQNFFQVPFCIDSLRTAGIQCRALTIITGETGGGKSLLCTQQLLYTYTELQVPVAMLSLEMTERECRDRFLSIHYNIPIVDLTKEEPVNSEEQSKHKQYFTKEEYEEYLGMNDNLFKDDFFIADTPALTQGYSVTVEEIRTYIQVLIMVHNVKVIVIDYLQLIKFPSNKPRWESLSDFAKELHQIALKHGIVFLLPSQVYRDKQSGTVKTTGTSELKTSASTFVNIKNNEDDPACCDIEVVKGRHSKAGDKYSVQKANPETEFLGFKAEESIATGGMDA